MNLKKLLFNQYCPWIVFVLFYAIFTLGGGLLCFSEKGQYSVDQISGQNNQDTTQHSVAKEHGQEVSQEIKVVEPKKPKIETVEIEGAKWVLHKVRPGDTLEEVAKFFAVHGYMVEKWNPGKVRGKQKWLRKEDVLRIKIIRWYKYEGKASWYGKEFHGKPRADGRIYDMNEILIAHRNLPIGTIVKITNLSNKKTIVAEVKDRGPFYKNAKGKYDREVDLSLGAAKELGAVDAGVIPVLIEPIGPEILIEENII